MPVRQAGVPAARTLRGGVEWVLSLPPRVRYVLAWDHELCRALVAVYVRAVLGWLRRHARGRGAADGRGGAVAIVQRFGAALNLNVHIHALVMDGVFVPDRARGVRFCPVQPMGADDVAALLTTIERRIEKLLARRGVSDGNEGCDVPDRYADEAPTLAGLAAASVRGVAALGARAGVPVRVTVPIRRHSAAGTPVSMGSISTRALWYRRAIVTDWSGCAGMPCVRQSGRTGCS